MTGATILIEPFIERSEGGHIHSFRIATNELYRIVTSKYARRIN